MTLKLLFAALSACLAAPASAVNLLTNGSFETPNIVPSGIYLIYSQGSTALTGWTVVGSDVHNTPDTYLGLRAIDGHQWVDLTGITGYDKGLRSDAVATDVGKVYTLSFDLGNYLPFGVSTLGLSINGAVEQLSLLQNSLHPVVSGVTFVPEEREARRLGVRGGPFLCKWHCFGWCG